MNVDGCIGSITEGIETFLDAKQKATIWGIIAGLLVLEVLWRSVTNLSEDSKADDSESESDQETTTNNEQPHRCR